MSPQQLARVKRLLALALQKASPERVRLLDEECGPDVEVREEVERLLTLSESAGSFLGTSIPDHLAASANSAREVPEGTRLSGRYMVERTLGKGGFATVYKARDMNLAGKPVVIKILDRVWPGDTALRGAFDSELEALSRIAHPNVVGISDLGRLEDGTPFLVLQFVEGITLREALQGGPLSIERVGSILTQVGQALAAAHRVAVLHLDLKPENIILAEPGTPAERASIIDFGTARLKDTPAGGKAITGSPRYMAPERTGAQATDKPPC